MFEPIRVKYDKLSPVLDGVETNKTIWMKNSSKNTLSLWETTRVPTLPHFLHPWRRAKDIFEFVALL
jgi:hypothetical protein